MAIRAAKDCARMEGSQADMMLSPRTNQQACLKYAVFSKVVFSSSPPGNERPLTCHRRTGKTTRLEPLSIHQPPPRQGTQCAAPDEMAPTHSRAPSLPSIPDVDFDFDEKSQLLPELDDMLSLAGCDDTATLDEENNSQISRSRSTHAVPFDLQPRRIPVRFPSSSSSSTTSTTSSTTYSAALPFAARCTDLACQSQAFQVPASQKTVLESWTITYHQPTTHPTSQYRALGITWWQRTRREAGSIQSVVPNTHLSQAELAAAIQTHAASHRNATRPPPTEAAGGGDSSAYARGLEARLRALEWPVQDEVHELLGDREQSSSTAFRRREWRVVALSEVPGGELTDARPTDLARRRDEGHRPWRTADEREGAGKRRCSRVAGKSEQYGDF
ncbi:hypothetical protein BT67DRAFT_436401 [Trichocladium antarcticum]|uniref:Uncharacterized protein n=1 Tax=Trichocladium antarcticum TaxID=1450529 RepID=A0AAN6UDX2_9PEZI|nr:hypothetical protein BT67DRAFT_436401 [Trichocladium antarcticum]